MITVYASEQRGGRIKLTTWVNKNRIRMTVQWIDANPNMADMPAGSRHFSCVLRMGKHQMTIPFSQGPAIEHEPAAGDVLDCLASDAAGFENAQSFEDWTSEYGYDSDSRKAEKIFHNVERQSAKLKQFLGDNLYQELLWNVERD